MWSSWNQALQARWRLSASAVALMMMSLKETLLPPWSPSCLFRASRASPARSMSTSLVRKKWGMGPSDVASRFAIVLRICVSGTSWYAPSGRSGSGTRETGNVGGEAATVAAPWRSRLTTLPLGQRLARLHCVAVPLVPLGHAPFLHGGGERFHIDVGGHGVQSR